MTLLIAYLLLHQMGAGFGAYIWTFVLWVVHLMVTSK